MKISKQQIQNLIVFLNRVNLSGQEAETLVQLKIVLAKELDKQPEEIKENGK